jgi:hypothetical protein
LLGALLHCILLDALLFLLPGLGGYPLLILLPRLRCPLLIQLIRLSGALLFLLPGLGCALLVLLSRLLCPLLILLIRLRGPLLFLLPGLCVPLLLLRPVLRGARLHGSPGLLCALLGSSLGRSLLRLLVALRGLLVFGSVAAFTLRKDRNRCSEEQNGRCRTRCSDEFHCDLLLSQLCQARAQPKRAVFGGLMKHAHHVKDEQHY